MALTPKQKRFVAEYAKDLNATQAAIRTGYSRKTAKQQGSRLLTNANVEAALAKYQAEHAEKDGLTQAEILRELKAIAIASAEPEGLRYADKLKALELLGKHLKLFTDKVEHGLSKSLEDLINQSIEASK